MDFVKLANELERALMVISFLQKDTVHLMDATEVLSEVGDTNDSVSDEMLSRIRVCAALTHRCSFDRIEHLEHLEVFLQGLKTEVARLTQPAADAAAATAKVKKERMQ